jgi:hypothetical protein
MTQQRSLCDELWLSSQASSLILNCRDADSKRSIPDVRGSNKTMAQAAMSAVGVYGDMVCAGGSIAVARSSAR